MTIVGGFVSQLFLSAQQHQRAIELKIQEQNAGPYSEFIALWFDVLNRQMLQQKPMSRAELIPKMSKLSNSLLLWSSNDFVHAYNDFRRLSARAEKLPDAPPHVKTLFVFEDMLVVMREGMGHSSEGIRRGELLSFFITNVDDLDLAIASEWSYGQDPLGNGPV